VKIHFTASVIEDDGMGCGEVVYDSEGRTDERLFERPRFVI